MELHRLLIFVCFTLVVVASHATISAEDYWSTKLPNTTMPKPLKGFLHPGGVIGDPGKGWSKGVIPQGPYYGNPGRIDPQSSSGRAYYSESFSKINPQQKQYHGGVSHGFNPNVTYYILEKNLKPGITMNLNLTKMSYMVSFLPRKVADSLPFSSNKLPEIFNKFSVKPGSKEAKILTGTIKDCEGPGIKGEEKFCATSLESMIDYSISKLGNNPQPISTEVEKQTKLQKYRIKNGVKKMSVNTSVVCHVQSYPYAVFYCHQLKATSAYMVPLEAADGTKANGVAVCHKDTSGWNPQHLAFQILKVKPGTSASICHVLDEGNIVWVSQ